jgi:ketosteroid isomerase-like protein
MRNLLHAISCGVLASSLIVSIANAANTSDRAKVEAVATDWFRGMTKGDPDIIIRLYAEGARQNSECKEGRVAQVGQRERLSRTFAGYTGHYAYEYEDIEIHGDMGFVVGLYATLRFPKAETGKPMIRSGRFLLIMRKGDAGWQIWRDMDNRTPDANKLVDQLTRQHASALARYREVDAVPSCD